MEGRGSKGERGGGNVPSCCFGEVGGFGEGGFDPGLGGGGFLGAHCGGGWERVGGDEVEGGQV